MLVYTLQQRSFPSRETAERRIKWLLSSDCVETYRLQQRKVNIGEKVRNGETGLDICKCLSARRGGRSKWQQALAIVFLRERENAVVSGRV